MTAFAAHPDSLGRSENDYLWVPQLCPICAVKPNQFLGYRGGNAHRQRLGVICAVWKCGSCGLRFPNPMPLPKRGLDQHYKLDPSNYFATHDRDAKLALAHSLLKTAAHLGR